MAAPESAGSPSGEEREEAEVCPAPLAVRDDFSDERPPGKQFSVASAKAETNSASISDAPEPDAGKRSILVRSSPAQFPDIRDAGRSAFATIFVAASSRKPRDDFPRRKSASEWETSAGGGRKGGGAEKVGGAPADASQWEVHPIAESSLFTFRIGDCVHRTKKPFAVEERMATGSVQRLRSAYNWQSGSVWTGSWDALGMAGAGTLFMPHGVTYEGQMVDGMFHDDNATLIYPNGFRALHCKYVEGELLDCQFQFPDLLNHEKENWDYCRYPDRRFWNEIQNGLRAAKVTQKTQRDPPRKVPPDSYDTNDGFYNPKTKMLVNEVGSLLRVPTNEEDEWIRQKCRRGFHQYTGFRPELYENWFADVGTVKLAAEMEERHFAGEITDEELRQFYESNSLAPAFTQLKNEADFDAEREKRAETYPTPRKLTHRSERRYEGHTIPLESRVEKSVDDCKKLTKRKMQQQQQQQLKSAKPPGKPSAERFPMRVKFEDSSKIPLLTAANFSANGKCFGTLPREGEAKSRKSLSSYLDLPEVRDGFGFEYSGRGTESLAASMKRIIMEVVQGIVLRERERHRDRFVRSQRLNNMEFGPRDEKERCTQMLEEMYESTLRVDEYCDSASHSTCDLRRLAKDRFQMVKYWGNRIFTLGFDEN